MHESANKFRKKPEGSEARESAVSLVVVHGDPAVGLTLLLTLQADGEGHAHRMTEQTNRHLSLTHNREQNKSESGIFVRGEKREEYTQRRLKIKDELLSRLTTKSL